MSGGGGGVDISEPEVVQAVAPVTSGGARHFPDGVHLQIRLWRAIKTSATLKLDINYSESQFYLHS